MINGVQNGKKMKNQQKRKIYFTSVLSLVVFLSCIPQKVFAQCATLKEIIVTKGEYRTLDDLQCLVLRSIEILLIFAGVYAVVRIVLAGIQYSAAIGNPEKMTEAKKALIWSVIGFVVAMSAYAIMSFIVTALG